MILNPAIKNLLITLLLLNVSKFAIRSFTGNFSMIFPSTVKPLKNCERQTNSGASLRTREKEEAFFTLPHPFLL